MDVHVHLYDFSLLSIGYLMPIVGRAYFRKPSEKDEHLHEAP